jgi:hypothetical protein
MIARLALWFFFTVLVAVSPVLCAWQNSSFDPQPHTLWEILGRGDLFLITCGLAAAAIGEVIASGTERITYKVVCAGACLVIVLFTASAYGRIADRVEFKMLFQPDAVAIRAIFYFIGTMIASTFCLALGQKNQNDL